jgi:CrcB protein
LPVCLRGNVDPRQAHDGPRRSDVQRLVDRVPAAGNPIRFNLCQSQSIARRLYPDSCPFADVPIWETNMEAIARYSWVAIGGALGSISRYWMSTAVTGIAGEAFPWGTLLINVLGSFVIGWFGTLTLSEGPWPASVETRLFVMVGLCGGFTTFSAFSLQTLDLLRDGKSLLALMYILASIVLCVGGTALGHYLIVGIGPRA